VRFKADDVSVIDHRKVQRSRRTNKITRQPASRNLLLSSSFTVDDFQYSYRLGTLLSAITWSAMVGDDGKEDDPVAMVMPATWSSLVVLDP
jgi:hypothetical protein